MGVTPVKRIHEPPWVGLPQWLSGKESACNAGAAGRCRFNPWVRKILWRGAGAWQPTAGFLLGKSHGQRSLEGYSPWGQKVSDTQVTNTSLTLG